MCTKNSNISLNKQILMPPIDIVSLLTDSCELHLLDKWGNLSDKEKKSFIEQVRQINFQQLQKQKDKLSESSDKNKATTFEAYHSYQISGSKQRQEMGLNLIKQGRVGCVVLAGGQGTRLGFNGPKGLFPISPLSKKTLFQVLAEKVLAASIQAGMSLQIAIMTSPQNDEQTRDYFLSNENFGLDPFQINFFSQGQLPLLNTSGELFFEDRGVIAEGPYGNGKCCHDFMDSPIAEKWRRLGIQQTTVIPIDNPLADPYDAELVGHQVENRADLTLKCVLRGDPEEHVGVVVREGYFCRVVEYSELSREEKYARLPDGSLKHQCANISLFCFSLSFINLISTLHPDLPLHPTYKKAKAYNDDEDNDALISISYAWKFEFYIFDLMVWANKTAVILFPREDCFAPLKNVSGDCSIETVQQKIRDKEKKILESIPGQKVPETAFELPAQFYYPTEELK